MAITPDNIKVQWDEYDNLNFKKSRQGRIIDTILKHNEDDGKEYIVLLVACVDNKIREIDYNSVEIVTT